MTSTPSTPAEDAVAIEHLDPGAVSCDWHFEVVEYPDGDLSIRHAPDVECAEAATVGFFQSCGHIFVFCDEHGARMQGLIEDGDLVFCTTATPPQHRIPMPVHAVWSVL